MLEHFNDIVLPEILLRYAFLLCYDKKKNSSRKENYIK